MKNRRNYYRILHVQPDAPAAIIKASYRALMQKLRMHPDLGGDEWNAAILNEAYAVLSHPGKRATYDRELQVTPTARTRSTRSAAEQHATRDPAASAGGDLSCPFCGNPHPSGFRYSEAVDCSGCSAPLEVATQPGLTGSLQRAMERRNHSASLRFFTSVEDHLGNPGTLRDLSPAGLQFTSPVECAANQIIRIDSGVLAATVRITRCHRETGGPGYRIGGAFLTLRFLTKHGTFVSENA